MNRTYCDKGNLITGGIFWLYFFLFYYRLFMNIQVGLHHEPLLISDPDMYTVTHTVGAKVQKNPLLLLNPPSLVHITSCVTASCNLSQPLCGILTLVRKAILDSWAKTTGEAPYKIICDSCGAKGSYQRFNLCSNERYLPGVRV